ncbi:methyltransferase domain-containing protein [Clostridium sp.]|uniref:methyltransferase domain-containing protein n=1 Tax=Clostridium sp. TaxID=1506 RepID=UPI003D6D71B2
MEYIKLKEYWLSEEKKTFQGWDFSYISDRKSEESLPWNYDKIVQQYLNTNSILLDMGTGGGEHLLTIKHPYNNTFATEAYPPNFELCKSTLMPLGVDVRQVFNDNYMPFEDNMFDIIINRQASFDINEVYRLLKPKGLFITQQVGGLNNKELRSLLTGDLKEITYNEHTLKNNLILIQNKSMSILESDECFPKQYFFDVGALVYYAKIIEWEFPSFTVDNCFNQLCQLQSIVDQQGFVESKQHRFVIVAQKINQ